VARGAGDELHTAPLGNLGLAVGVGALRLAGGVFHADHPRLANVYVVLPTVHPFAQV